MMKHVVPDGKLGIIARRQWEITRRVLEGTLDAETVAQKLQGIIENSPGVMFGVEKPNYTVSEKVYSVTTEVDRDFCGYVLAKSYFLSPSFKLGGKNPYYGEMKVDKVGRYKRKLRLAQVDSDTSGSVLVIQAQQCGHVLADAWDLIAFFEQSPFGKLVYDKMKVHALGGHFLQEWFDKDGTSGNDVDKRKPCSISMRGGDRRWNLGESGRDDWNNRQYPINKGEYILLREK